MNIVSGRRVLVKLGVIIAVTLFVSTLGLVGGRQKAIASAAGPLAAHTNAPGEGNCTACHGDFPLNSGGGSVSIAGIPHDYMPGQQVAVTVKTSHSDALIYGFQLTAIDGLGREVGTFTVPADDPPKIQIIDGNVGGMNRKYVEHTVSGLITMGVFGSNSWTFTWTAPAQRVGKVRFYAAGNGANSDGDTSGDYIYTTEAASLSGTAVSNFDDDLQSDIAVFRPSTGVWYSFSIATGVFQSNQFGLAGDHIAPGDYDGDGKTDFAVFRPSIGTWFIQQSTAGPRGVQWGANGDVPAAGDYDGDGKTDVAVFRPSNGTWYLLQSTAGIASIAFGLSGDKVSSGDYDADGRTDIAVYRPSTGTWYIAQSSSGFRAMQFGTTEDRPVQSDYDGDGKTDIAVFRPSTGAWYVAKSTDGLFGMTFGFGTDVPSPADYDGDGKTDIAVYRPSSGVWYIAQSADNSFYVTVFGLNGDVPVAAGYIAE